jgi:hypothetical protein
MRFSARSIHGSKRKIKLLSEISMAGLQKTYSAVLSIFLKLTTKARSQSYNTIASMMRCPILVVVFVALSLQQVYGSYWDMPWSAVHDRPVFRVEPSIKWTFPHTPTATYGKKRFCW